MPKTWEDLTTEEKIEDLRRDMKRVFSIVDGLNHTLTRALHQMDRQASEVAKEIADLKKKLDQN